MDEKNQQTIQLEGEKLLCSLLSLGDSGSPGQVRKGTLRYSARLRNKVQVKKTGLLHKLKLTTIKTQLSMNLNQCHGGNFLFTGGRLVLKAWCLFLH